MASTLAFPARLLKLICMMSVFSPMGVVSPARSMVDYMRSCVQCETRMVLTPAQIRQLRPCMYFDRRRTADGTHGRSISRDFPDLGLLRNSRLEPSATHPDIHNFSAEHGDRHTIWWRRKQESGVRRRNPLFSSESGVSIDSIAVDWLHTLSLGVFQHLLGAFVWNFVEADSFHVNQTTKQARLDLSVAQIRNQLFDLHKAESLEIANTAEHRVWCLLCLGATLALI